MDWKGSNGQTYEGEGPEDLKQIEMVQFEYLDPLTFYPFYY